jgi:hypothetical protein
MRHPSAFAADCHLTDDSTRELELGTHLAQPLTSGFSCTNAERAQVRTVLGRAVTVAELRRAVGTAVVQAQHDARAASRALRARPRSVRTSRIFRSIFNVPPTFVPAWRPRNASWPDLGALVALRIENGSRILGGGYMHFFCWGSAARCPECNEPPSSYRACSSYRGRHHICLGREWWKWYRDGHGGFMASTLLHEAMHIYFRLEHHKATVGRPSVNNMYCYDILVAILSGRAPKPGDRNKCARGRRAPDHEYDLAESEFEDEVPRELDRGSPFNLAGWIGGAEKLREPSAPSRENLSEGELEGEWEDPWLPRPIQQGSEFEPEWEEEFGLQGGQAGGYSHVLAEAPTRLGPAAATSAPRLRTALDSRVRVSGTPEQYTIGLDLDAPTGGQSLVVADYQPIASTPLRRLPVFIEDIVTGDRAIVNIRRDPAAAVVTPRFRAGEAAGRHVEVRIFDTVADELQVAAAPPVRNVPNGVIVDGRENVTQHSSGSEIDKIMGSIAPAEGGFASVEGSDRGVFTWGQGQWTVTGGELQKVMAFIKANRQDLFDRYWGFAGLDISAGARPTFVYGGRRYETGPARMATLFRSDRARLRSFAEIFAQAGMDPQIQRLQREYMRGEVAQLLSTPVEGLVPQEVLNSRAKAFYYSMNVNGPRFALQAFRAAVRETQLYAGAQVTEAIRVRISAALEAYFRNSGVVAWDSGGHHILGFWGERGRRQALDLADQHIQAPAPGDIWSVTDWTRYREGMTRRESRYQKTASEITRALAHGRNEPDVPQ